MRTQANFGETSPNNFEKNYLAGPPYGMNMYYVYILLNDAKTKTYTGVAEDVNERLAVHNAGRVKASRPYRPYNIIHTEEFETLKEARQKEKYYKSTTGRRRIKEIFFSP
jgi:putative endonuclease